MKLNHHPPPPIVRGCRWGLELRRQPPEPWTRTPLAPPPTKVMFWNFWNSAYPWTLHVTTLKGQGGGGGSRFYTLRYITSSTVRTRAHCSTALLREYMRGYVGTDSSHYYFASLSSRSGSLDVVGTRCASDGGSHAAFARSLVTACFGNESGVHQGGSKRNVAIDGDNIGLASLIRKESKGLCREREGFHFYFHFRFHASSLPGCMVKVKVLRRWGVLLYCTYLGTCSR